MALGQQICYPVAIRCCPVTIRCCTKGVRMAMGQPNVHGTTASQSHLDTFRIASDCLVALGRNRPIPHTTVQLCYILWWPLAQTNCWELTHWKPLLKIQVKIIMVQNTGTNNIAGIDIQHHWIWTMGRYLGAHNWCYGAVSDGLSTLIYFSTDSRAVLFVVLPSNKIKCTWLHKYSFYAKAHCASII